MSQERLRTLSLKLRLASLKEGPDRRALIIQKHWRQYNDRMTQENDMLYQLVVTPTLSKKQRWRSRQFARGMEDGLEDAARTGDATTVIDPAALAKAVQSVTRPMFDSLKNAIDEVLETNSQKGHTPPPSVSRSGLAKGASSGQTSNREQLASIDELKASKGKGKGKGMALSTLTSTSESELTRKIADVSDDFNHRMARVEEGQAKLEKLLNTVLAEVRAGAMTA